jgi:hypothetical protein
VALIPFVESKIELNGVCVDPVIHHWDLKAEVFGEGIGLPQRLCDGGFGNASNMKMYL